MRIFPLYVKTTNDNDITIDASRHGIACGYIRETFTETVTRTIDGTEILLVSWHTAILVAFVATTRAGFALSGPDRLFNR